MTKDEYNAFKGYAEARAKWAIALSNQAKFHGNHNESVAWNHTAMAWHDAKDELFKLVRVSTGNTE